MAVTTVDRLRVVYELDDRRARDGYNRMRSTTRLAHNDIIRGATNVEARSKAAFAGLSKSAVAATAKVLGLAAAMTKLTQFANDYTTVENRLRSIGQFSDDAAEKLLGASMRSRSAVTEMSTAVARIQKATGDGFDQTIRRVETLNKLLAVGGSTTAEQISVMTQLSQALSSGTLQGDELRSLREAAPIEVLDAIAKAAGVTRGELKKMGEEGKLTSDIVIEALDSLAETADRKLGDALISPTAAFTILSSAATVFFGRLDEGLGTTQALSKGMQDLATFLAENVDEAEQFGIALGTALSIADEEISNLGRAARSLADNIYENLTGGAADFGDAWDESGMTVGSVLQKIINTVAEFAGVIEGAGEATREVFLSIVDSVTAGMDGAIDGVLTGVEVMINGLLSGVRKIALILKVLNPSMDLSSVVGSGGFTLDRPAALATSLASGDGVGAAYDRGYNRGKAGVLKAGEAIQDLYTDTADFGDRYFGGLRDRFEQENNRRQTMAQVKDQTQIGLGLPAEREEGSDGVPPSTDDDKGKGKKGGGGKEKKEKSLDPFFAANEEDQLQLERQIELLGNSTFEIAKQEAAWALLDEAKKRGMPLTESLLSQIDEQATSIGNLTLELEEGQIALQEFEARVESIAGVMADWLLGGESLRQGLSNVFKGIAMDILKSGISEALTSTFGPDAEGGGGGGIWGVAKAAIGGFFKGKRAMGGPVEAGQMYMTGERGPEPFVPAEKGRILSVQQAQEAYSGRGGRGGNTTMAVSIDLRGTTGDKALDAKIRQAAQATLQKVPEMLANREKRGK